MNKRSLHILELHKGKVIPIMCFLAIILSGLSLHAQSPDPQFNAIEDVAVDDIVILFKQDFENTTPGPYLYSEWQRDWNYPSWNNGLDRRCSIVDKDGNRVMRSYTPEGQWGLLTSDTDTNGGGFQWWTPVPGNPTEMYMSYNIMFRPGVDFVLSGKIPGLLGGPQDYDPGRAPNWEEGFTAFLAFNGYDPRGLCAFYLYHQDQTGDYGDLLIWPDPFNKDERLYVFKEDNINERWINITIRVVLNTLNGSGGNYDGILEGFIDGRLMFKRSGLKLRNVPGVTIDHIMMSWFYGGASSDFATTSEEWVLFDDIHLFNYLPGTGIPTGNTTSPSDRVLDLPWIRNPAGIPGDADQEPPTVPTNVQVSATSSNSVTLTWSPSTDNIKVTGYRIFMNNNLEAAISATSFKKTGLSPETSYSFSVSAFDAAGNESLESDIVVGVTDEADTEVPTAPENLRVTRFSGYSIDIEWDRAVDNVGIDRYGIFLDGDNRFSTVDNLFIIPGLTPNTSYSISVRAFDTSNNASPFSNTISQTTAAPDTQPPSTPSGLQYTDVTEKTVTLQWEPSTDNVGVREYRIYVNNLSWESSTRSDETIAGLQPGLSYSISVTAVDEAGNESPKSTSVNVTTKNGDNTTEPTLPTISIIQVQDKTIKPNSVSEVGSLGFVELTNYGIEVSEPDNPGKETLVFQGLGLSQVVNTSRVKKGLQVLYNFAEGSGNTVEDISGIEPPIDLNISREGLATEWLTGQGLRIIGNTSISHQGFPTRLIDSLSATNEITLEAWVKQEKVNQTGPARLITLSVDNSSRAATLAHDGNVVSYNYASRLNTSGTDENGTPEFKTTQDFFSSSLHHIVYTRNRLGSEKIYVNGMELASGVRDGDFSSWRNDYTFMLANEITGDRPWKGVFYLVAAYNRALSREEVVQNHTSGFGNIRFTIELDTLASNVAYKLTPFVSTDQGLVFGKPKDFLYQNVTKTDSLLSVYPNPNTGNVIVTIKNRDENVNVGFLRLADFSGHIHFSKEIDLSEGLLENVFELRFPETLKSGFYSLILIAGARSAAEKLVLIR